MNLLLLKPITTLLSSIAVVVILIHPAARADSHKNVLKTPIQVAVEQLGNVRNTLSVAPIDGAWSLQGPEYAACAEVYNFSPGKQLRITSANEVSTAKYEFIHKISGINNADNQENADGEAHSFSLPLPVLSFVITNDNNEPDCLGYQEDQSGHTQTWFVKLSDNDRLMEWCLDANDCKISLKRLLP